jgi:outer membrane protein assembly factor BamB
MDFKVQHYRGEPVLTWAEGEVVQGHGHSEYVILDGSYQEVTRLGAGYGYQGDHHEFLISSQDIALFTIYGKARMDLPSAGGPEDGKVFDGIVQGVDIETGEVLFEWNSLDHVGLEESYSRPSKDQEGSFDYLHINSIDVDHDGNLLVSSRNTWTVYKVDSKTGEVIWRLGGARRATSRWVRVPDSPSSTTPGASPTVPSPSSITAARTKTSSPVVSCSTSTRTR